MAEAYNPRTFLEQFLSDESSKSSPFYQYLNPNFDLAQGTTTTQPGNAVKSQLEQLYGGFVNPIERSKEYAAAYGELPRRLRSGISYLFGVNEQLQNQAAADRRGIQNQLLFDYEKASEGIGNELARLKQSGATPAELDRYSKEASAVRSSYWQPYLAARQYGTQMQKLEGLAGRIAAGETFAQKSGLQGGPLDEYRNRQSAATKKYAEGLYNLYSSQSAADLTAGDYGQRPGYSAAERALYNELSASRGPQTPQSSWGKKDPNERREGRSEGKKGGSGLNLAAGGSADILNRKDIRAAKESGMTRKEIRQAVKEGDVRVSAKAKAALYKGK